MWLPTSVRGGESSAEVNSFPVSCSENIGFDAFGNEKRCPESTDSVSLIKRCSVSDWKKSNSLAPETYLMYSKGVGSLTWATNSSSGIHDHKGNV